MNILAIGDIVGAAGVDYVANKLNEIKKRDSIDFVTANGENSAGGKGITLREADRLFEAGVDVVTLGNHTFAKKDVANLLLNRKNVIRPINYPPETMGNGYTVKTVGGKRVAVINALGRVNVMTVDCPFRAVDKKIKELSGVADIILLDFHAEVTGEKCAMGYFAAGRATCVFGTHTHVQTADERVLAGGTGYITDLGMTGPAESVLGMKKEIIIRKFLTQIPQRYEVAEGKITMCGAIFKVDDHTNKCVDVKRLKE